MELHRIAIRVLFSFLYLLIMIRLSGKRTISQSDGFDFVLSIIIGDLVDDLLFVEVSAAEFVVAAGTLVSLDLALKVICRKNDRLLFLAEGRPTILMQDGKPDSGGMKSELVNIPELAVLLRQEGFEENKWNEIKLSVLEDSGEASVLRKYWAKGIQWKDRHLLKVGK